MTSKLNISTATDEVLVRSAQKGDMAAFEELVARHRDKIYARAFSMLRNEDDATDLSQEAWVKGWQRLHQFQGEASFATWMTRSMRARSVAGLSRPSRLTTAATAAARSLAADTHARATPRATRRTRAGFF